MNINNLSNIVLCQALNVKTKFSESIDSIRTTLHGSIRDEIAVDELDSIKYIMQEMSQTIDSPKILGMGIGEFVLAFVTFIAIVVSIVLAGRDRRYRNRELQVANYKKKMREVSLASDGLRFDGTFQYVKSLELQIKFYKEYNKYEQELLELIKKSQNLYNKYVATLQRYDILLKIPKTQTNEIYGSSQQYKYYPNVKDFLGGVENSDDLDIQILYKRYNANLNKILYVLKMLDIITNKTNDAKTIESVIAKLSETVKVVYSEDNDRTIDDFCKGKNYKVKEIEDTIYDGFLQGIISEMNNINDDVIKHITTINEALKNGEPRVVYEEKCSWIKNICSKLKGVLKCGWIKHLCSKMKNKKRGDEK